jgi:hypothetical protein
MVTNRMITQKQIFIPLIEACLPGRHLGGRQTSLRSQQVPKGDQANCLEAMGNHQGESGAPRRHLGDIQGTATRHAGRSQAEIRIILGGTWERQGQ